MKTKIAVLVGIALCAMLLISPALAGASENALEIYGNANEDDTIDMRDLTYVKLIFFGKKPETELADAKYDDKINPLDFIQIKLIIVGKEKELTFIDSVDRIVTVNKPVERIIPFSSYVTEVMRSIKAPMDKIVAVPEDVAKSKAFFQELANLPNVGSGYTGTYDYEKIAELQPDLFILYASSLYDEVANKVESIVPCVAMVRFSFGYDKEEDYIDWVRKLGYILDKQDEAEELIDFHRGVIDEIKSRTEALSENEKPRVFYTWPSYFPGTYYTHNRFSGVHNTIVWAGGVNIAADLAVETGKTGTFTIDPEWPLEQDPEIILGAGVGYTEDKPTEAEMETLRDKIINQPGWGYMTGVKSNKVYLIDHRISGWGTPMEQFIGTAYMAKMFHPNIFEDLDPQAIHQEYLTRFQSLDPNVIENWVFIYPSPSE